VHNTPTPRRFAYDGDIPPIPTEEVCIFRGPLDREALVVQPSITDAAGGFERRARKPPQRTETVVDLDEDDALAAAGLTGLDQSARVSVGGFRPEDVAAAEDPSLLLVLAFHSGCHDSYQSKTAAFLPFLFRLSNTCFGTNTSRNRQSSVSSGEGAGACGALPNEAASCASAAERLKAVALPSMKAMLNSSPIAPHKGEACGQILPWAPVCTCVLRPVGETGALKRRFPTGGCAKRILLKLYVWPVSCLLLVLLCQSEVSTHVKRDGLVNLVA
jgi:hypothetical protein